MTNKLNEEDKIKLAFQYVELINNYLQNRGELNNAWIQVISEYSNVICRKKYYSRVSDLSVKELVDRWKNILKL